jgi:imidazolonepropionase-like amidohydrolase
MRAMAESGLTNRRILESATAAPGAYFADSDSFGVIRPGARADMVLLAADPLQDLETLSHPEGVMLRGRWISAAEIDARLAEIAKRNAGQDEPGR